MSYSKSPTTSDSFHCVGLQVSKLVNGQDVSLKLVLQSEITADRPLSLNISVQGMRYNGSPAVNIQSEVKEGTLQPGKGDASSSKIFLCRNVAVEFWRN